MAKATNYNLKLYPKKKVSNWILMSKIGEGGNGMVWKCKNKAGEQFAIKFLKKTTIKAYKRFRDEITFLEQYTGIVGIMPVVDKNLPQTIKGYDYKIPLYFVMPLAESAENKLYVCSLSSKVSALEEIITMLCNLHANSIAHRDIKPENILFYDGKYVLSDFGLVYYKKKERVSSPRESIGAKWTIAPEMKRDAVLNADKYKADVYSIAKTIWIILSGQKQGFEGQYIPISSIGLNNFINNIYLTPLDRLLSVCTDHLPENRPDIDIVLHSLKDWYALNNDFERKNLTQWFEIQNILFPSINPQRAIWESSNDILSILKTICKFDNLNHLFFPSGGGLDLTDVAYSHEPDCLELNFGGLVTIVKPKKLLFESFGDEPQWNYFRLELGELKAEMGDTKPDAYDEGVSELSPMKYFPYHIMEDPDNFREKYPITESSRQVTRQLRGSYVIFCKRSIYNKSHGTYDGRHEKMDTDTFRKYIERQIYLSHNKTNK